MDRRPGHGALGWLHALSVYGEHVPHALSEFQTFSSPVATASGAFVGSIVATARGIVALAPSHFTNDFNVRTVAFERNQKLEAISSRASNAALLDSIFEDLTRVVGTSTNAMDPGALANTLNTAYMTPKAVANDLLPSFRRGHERVGCPNFP
jgi:hypothetical protein